MAEITPPLQECQLLYEKDLRLEEPRLYDKKVLGQQDNLDRAKNRSWIKRSNSESKS